MKWKKPARLSVEAERLADGEGVVHNILRTCSGHRADILVAQRDIRRSTACL